MTTVVWRGWGRYDGGVRHRLISHPDAPSSAVIQIAADIARTAPGMLTLRYVLTGALGGVVLPARVASARAEELWRHTCFEVFAQGGSGSRYVEINLAPSTRWAAYRFDGYRRSMAPAMVPDPVIEAAPAGDTFALTATLDLSAELPAAETWRLALTAVVEETGGRISYWSLAHPPGKPDFHHADCFALQLPPPDRP
jgi:hypothetical protein